MKHIFYSIIIFTLISAQDDRSTVFSTGNPPELGVGWDIKCTEYSNLNVGDINQDENVDVLDVVTIVGFILGNSTPTEEEATYSDTNEDSNIDVLVRRGVAISADGKYIVVGCEDGEIRLFDKDSSTPLWTYDTGGSISTVAMP